MIEGRPEEECNCEFYEKACEIYSDENRGYCAIAECCTSGDVDKTDCLRVDAASTKTRHAQSLVAKDTDAWFTISQITQAAFDLGDTIMSMDQLGDAEDFILDDFLLTDDSTNFTWTVRYNYLLSIVLARFNLTDNGIFLIGSDIFS